MARARGIKPGFFNDPDVVELPFEGRLLFIGLWTLADRSGRLVDKPRHIRMAVFPSDVSIDVDALLDKIAKAGLILRYEVADQRYIQVTGFSKHQNPHRDEKASTLPPPELDASTMRAPCEHHASTMPCTLTPDSGLLTPDSPTPTSNIEEVGNAVGAAFADASTQTGPKPGPDPNPDPKAKPPFTKKTRPRSPIPSQFYPDATGLAKAADKGASVAVELTKFCDWHKAKGSLMADWQAAWRTWVSNAKPGTPAGAFESFRQRDDRIARARWEEMTGQVHPDNLLANTAPQPVQILEILQ